VSRQADAASHVTGTRGPRAGVVTVRLVPGVCYRAVLIPTCMVNSVFVVQAARCDRQLDWIRHLAEQHAGRRDALG
jgi:hypothetical protein